MFCKFCGKQIEENSVCECQKAEAVEAVEAVEVVESVKPVKNETITGNEKKADLVHDILEEYLGILKAPVTNGVKFLDQKKRINSLVMIAFQAFLTALFGMGIIIKLNQFIDQAGEWFADYKFSVASGFFITLLLSLLGSLVGVLLFLLVLKILKKEFDIDYAVSFLAVRSVIISPLIAGAIIFLFVIPKFSFLLFSVTVILSIVYLTIMAKERSDMDKNKLFYLIFASFIIFIFITSFIFSKSLVLYLPESLKAVMNGDFSDILGSMLF